MGNKLYKPKRKKSKEKLSLLDKIEIGGITIAAAALIGWSGWSVVDALTPATPIPTYEVYMNGINAYLLTSAGSDSSEDIEDETIEDAADTDDSTETAQDTDNTADATATPESTATPEPSSTPKPTVTPEPTATPEPAPTDTPVPTEAPKTYTANDALNVRQTPDKSAKAVAMCKKGETLNVTEDESAHAGWYKIDRDGVQGYVSTEFVDAK